MFWTWGQKAAIAYLADIPRQNLYEILRRQRGVSVERAKLLEKASSAVLDKKILWTDWIDNATTDHPAFSPLKK